MVRGYCAHQEPPLKTASFTAYTSILRILHRHFSDPLTSTFVSALPSFGQAISDSHSVSIGMDLDTTSLTTQTDDILLETPSSDLMSMRTVSTQGQSMDHETDIQLNRMPTILTITPSVSTFTETQSVRSNTTLQNHTNFGAIPYPEWRTLLAERAQRAGLGESKRAIERLLLDPSPSYENQRHTSLFIVGRDALGPKIGSRRTVRRKTGPRSARPSPMPSPMYESPLAPAPWHDRFVSDAVGGAGDADSDSDSGNNSSEVEWLGWMGDLRRQSFVRKEKEQMSQQKESQDSDTLLTPLDNVSPTTDFSMPKPDDHRLFASQRYALEPYATVATFPIENSPEPGPSSPLPFPSSEGSARSSPGHHTALSMSSPSATDPPSPIRTRAISFGVASSEPVSLGASASRLHGEPKTPLEPFYQVNGLAPTSNGSSWEDLLARSQQGSRQRPDEIPAITPTRPIRVSTTSSVVQEHSSSAPGPSFVVGPHLSPNYERSSLSPIERMDGSLGRSSSVFSKGPSLLRKKSADPSLGSSSKSKRAKSSKGKEKEVSEPPPQDRSRRPRLSLSTGSHGNLRHHHSASNVSHAGSNPRSPSPSALRVMSGDEALSPTPANGVKKKRGFVGGMEKIAQRFDAAMDFVDGK